MDFAHWLEGDGLLHEDADPRFPSNVFGIGGGSLSGGQGTVLGAMIGALIMAFLRNGCQQMGWPNYIQEIIIGAIIVIAVAVDQLRARRT